MIEPNYAHAMKKYVAGSRANAAQYFLVVLASLASLFAFVSCNAIPSEASKSGENATIMARETEKTAPENGGGQDDPLKRELEKQKRIWTSKNLQDYDMVVSLYRGGLVGWARPVRIKVRSGKSISIEKIDKADSLGIEGYGQFATIEQIFNFLELNIGQEEVEISVKYNPEWGYPELVHVEYPEKGFAVYKRLEVKSIEKH